MIRSVAKNVMEMASPQSVPSSAVVVAADVPSADWSSFSPARSIPH